MSAKIALLPGERIVMSSDKDILTLTAKARPLRPS